MNPHSKLASIYRYFYLTGKLPNNLCNYCWGLVLAIVCMPFVWPALLMNVFNNVIRYKESSMPVYKDGKHIGTKEIKEYEVYALRPIATGMGFLFSFMIFIIGAVTLIILEKMDIINKFNTKNLSAISAVFEVYLAGIFAIAFSILMFYFVMAVSRIATSFKKELTKDEREAKYLAEDRYYADKHQKSWEKRKYREANPRFYTLLWRWIVAVKEKNCPMITWDYTKKK